MFPNDANRRGALRSARECALGVCALWLVVQNIVLVAVFLTGGAGTSWSALLPALGLAFALMIPLWLVPIGALAVAGFARRAAMRAERECAGAREVTR